MSEPTLPPDAVPRPTRAVGSPWPVPEAAAFPGVSPRHLLRLIDSRKVKAIKIGRRTLIPDSEVRRVATSGT